MAPRATASSQVCTTLHVSLSGIRGAGLGTLGLTRVVVWYYRYLGTIVTEAFWLRSRGTYMYLWLRMESGEMGEGGEERREVVGWCTVREFHGEYGGEGGFLGCLI